MAMIAESIKVAMETVKVMERQAAADRAAKAALETKTTKADKATQDLLQSLTSLQQNLVAAMRCRAAEKEFGENDIMPMKVVEAPPTHTLAFHPVREAVNALPNSI